MVLTSKDFLPRAWKSSMVSHCSNLSCSPCTSLSFYYIPESTGQTSQWIYRNAMINKFVGISLCHITYLKLTLPLNGSKGRRWSTCNNQPIKEQDIQWHSCKQPGYFDFDWRQMVPIIILTRRARHRRSTNSRCLVDNWIWWDIWVSGYGQAFR